jgi:hypothetical protein
MLAMLAGCAATPPTPIAEATPAAAIQVSCQTDALSEQPCIAQARRKCPDPTIDTIHLVLAKPVTTGTEQYEKQVYDYRATYTCREPGVVSAE